MKMWKKMFIGLVLGTGAGLLLGPRAEYLKPVGSLFLALLNMLVVLLVFSSLTVGVTSINNARTLGRIGLKTLLLYVITTLIAIGIGFGVALLLNPGVGIGLSHDVNAIHLTDKPKLLDIFLNLIPTNPIASFANGHVLQIIVFSIFLGLAINFAGEKAKPIVRLLQSLSEAMFSMTRIVMYFAPFGVFAIMAWVAGTFGIKILYPLLKLILAIYLACGLHLAIVFAGMLKFLARVRVKPFFKGMADAIALAASTTSSSATLPATLHCAEENLGISKTISSFAIPLGATINMNGTAIFQAIAAIFIAQAYGIDLTWQNLIIIALTSTLAAIGCAGIPGGGLVTLSIVLGSVGLPLEGIAIVAGIDRIRDIIGTVVNVLGDGVVAVYVAKT
ncbi:MAG TPA: dicarboxylate/amino acid:cation symporter, partial [Myxococcota bacterium]|nr:dicarboxylate/amino acid:cation symporter [Myxococcota bacterium]